MRRLIKFMAPYRVWAIVAPALMALEVAMDLAQPRLLQTIVDVGIANNDVPVVLNTLALMIAVAIVGAIGGIGCTIYATRAAQSFGTDVRAGLFRRVQQLSFSDLSRLETGRLVTRLTNDVDQVQEAAAMLLRILVRAPLLVVGSLIMAVVTSPSLSLLIFALSPLLIATFTIVTGRAQRLFSIVQDRLDRVNVTMLENLAGVRIIKAFVRSAHEVSRFGRANDEYMRATVRASVMVATIMPIMMFLINIGTVGVLWWGGLLVQEGVVQVGQILAFINYLMQMMASLMMVGMLVMRISRADASAERVLEVLDTEPSVQDAPDAGDLPEVRGSIRFEDVTFSYDGNGGEPVLRDVSFEIEPGETVAIIGATGSGKSTLVHLIPRFYDATEGRVLLEGRDVRALRQEDLRRVTATVLQETVLFTGTIRDNIRYACPDATDQQVEAAARVAQAHDFVASLPEGYDTLVGQRGVNLSGGQKQRLAIARALICEPAILIMDDCTSAVDATTEAAIVEALRDWPGAGTRLVITHRVGSILSADRILVLDRGTIAAEGTHTELLASSPIYREIVASQLGTQEVAV
ncbi:MAG: ABC transporter ATP-binding protein [candidate division WS1 bacterium]|nr:ABC transporter ATP-binding protein [candidate division WS1 bacterium]